MTIQMEAPVAAEPRVEHVDTLVVGAGQAGLAVGYHLKRRGIPFLILDAHERIGDPWRRRWDSLRLFTPARRDSLPGLPFPAPRTSYPTAAQMADYLESYAAHIELPIRTGVRVDAVGRSEDGFLVAAGDLRFQAQQVVIATGACQAPRVPDFASRLRDDIVQMHSSEYRNPAQLREGGVLVVGAGNSGADISIELSESRQVWLSGRHPGQVPVRIETRFARYVVFPILWQLWTHVLKRSNRIGRHALEHFHQNGEGLVRVKDSDIRAAGIERVARVADVRDGLPVLEDGRVMDVPNVIWCTGYRPSLDWLDLQVLDDDGGIVSRRGVTEEPGLYVIGQVFLHAFNSHTIGGVQRDAGYVAARIAERPRHHSTHPASPAVSTAGISGRL